MEVNIYRWSHMDVPTRSALLSRSKTDIAEESSAVLTIIDDVRKRGDVALRELNHRFDRSPMNAPLLLPDSDFDDAEKLLSQQVKDALEYAVENVRRYHVGPSFDAIEWKHIRPGITVGERITSIDSVAFYIPRARGSFPSMLYMMAVPAQIAGVPRMVMASPPDSAGKVDPACLYTARLCGVHTVYAMGGAQAWAALAYGTSTVQKIDKCIGPGSKYVAAAKRILADVLDCGLPAGPSESIILADATPDADDIARNMLVEAEHGADSAALLITDSVELAQDVHIILTTLGEELPEPRRTFVKAVFSGYGGIIIVDTMEQGIELVNTFATEHLQIRTADPSQTLGKIRHAGEILLGEYCPFSAANYAVGANAVLPTGGTARTWSAVSVADFQKRSSVVQLSAEGLANLKTHAATLAEYEGFPAHHAALVHHKP